MIRRVLCCQRSGIYGNVQLPIEHLYLDLTGSWNKDLTNESNRFGTHLQKIAFYSQLIGEKVILLWS